MKLKITLILTAFALLSVSCKKDEAKTFYKSKLINKNWKSLAFKIDGIREDKWCWKNSIYNFYEDGNMFITEGNNEGVCLGTVIGRIKKYSYTLSSDEKVLVVQYNIGYPDELDTFMIQSISETSLNMKRIVNKLSMPPGEAWEDEFTAIP